MTRPLTDLLRDLDRYLARPMPCSRTEYEARELLMECRNALARAEAHYLDQWADERGAHDPATDEKPHDGATSTCPECGSLWRTDDDGSEHLLSEPVPGCCDDHRGRRWPGETDPAPDGRRED